MKKCINCGKEIDSNAVYCPHCGKRTDGKAAIKIWQIALVLFVVVALAVGGIKLFGGQSGDEFHLLVKAEKVKVRNSHSDGGDHVGYIYNGDTVDAYKSVKADGKTWYQIGENAWVANEDRGLKVSAMEGCFDHEYVPMTRLGSLNVGSDVEFGSYNKQAINWVVVENTGKEMLLVSEKALDYRPFDTTYKTWEKSYIRKWLNSDFIAESFNEADVQAIINVVNYTERNDEESTIDRVFLLSESEVDMYLKKDTLKRCEPTELAIYNGADVKDGYCSWYLRTLNGDDEKVLVVRTNGEIAYNSHTVEDAAGIRPAIWVRITK